VRFDADMDIVKFALTVLSIAIVVVPVLDVVFIYRDNLPALILPSEFGQ